MSNGARQSREQIHSYFIRLPLQPHIEQGIENLVSMLKKGEISDAEEEESEKADSTAVYSE